MRHEVVRTRQGALAMRSVEAGEIMHPGVGPLVEAELLYVRQSRLAERLRAHDKAQLVVFDVGLGAGSNAALARAVSERAPAEAAQMALLSFEQDLDALRLALTEAAAFGLDGEAGIAARAILETGAHRTARTDWQLRRGDVLAALTEEPLRADIVFWDPFSPRHSPLLWTVAAFSALHRKAGAGCCVYTYSASTATRVAMLLAGWAVGVGDPIGDKSQTTVAAMRAGDLIRPLDRAWLTRLGRGDVPLPADAPADAVTRVLSAPQFRVARSTDEGA